MNRLIAFLLAAAATLLVTPALALDGGRFGDVHVTVPDGPMRGYVVVFSDIDGWTSTDQATLEALGKNGALAVGVDTKIYLDRIANGDRPCDSLVGDVESLSRQLQREHSGLEYHFPILAGVGEGGTLAGAVLSQAPVNMLAGAISLDPSLGLKGNRPICAGQPATHGDGGYVYGPIPSLHGFWDVGLTASEPANAKEHFDGLRASGTPLSVQSVNSGGRDEMLAELIVPHLDQGTALGVAALPLIELPASKPSGLMAIVLSGDGGWRDLDKTIAEDLQSQGVSVVGWDSVRYFWSEKSPQQTAADLASVISTYGAKWHSDKVALIGYSFGADVLPFAYDRLPPELRQRVALVSLLGFAGAADWKISVEGWLGAPPSAEATPVGPAIERMPGALIQCFYGEEESDSFCPQLISRGAEVIRTAGGHHFDGDYLRLTLRIVDGFKRRAGRQD